MDEVRLRRDLGISSPVESSIGECKMTDDRSNQRYTTFPVRSYTIYIYQCGFRLVLTPWEDRRCCVVLVRGKTLLTSATQSILPPPLSHT